MQRLAYYFLPQSLQIIHASAQIIQLAQLAAKGLIRRIAAILGFALLITTAASAHSSKKPNILYIMTDDHAAHAVGAYGSRLASVNPTPTLDALAQEGTLFTNVFASNSICTPSRATILTGQYSQTNKVLDLYGTLPEAKQTLPKAMNAAGYDTAIVGKWHLHDEPAAFNYYNVLPVQGKYFDPSFRSQGEKPWPQNTQQYRGHSSDVVANHGIHWLRNRDTQKPFFLMLQFKAPHDMFEYAPRYEFHLADVDIPEPVDLYQRHPQFGSVATRGENDSLVRKIGTSISERNPRRNIGQDLSIDSSLSGKAYTRTGYQKYLKAYLRCVKGVDDNIARVFESLKASGEWDNTIVIYTSDQGMMLGEHDLIDKRWMYDESMQMPFIVRHPHKSNAPTHSDLLINNTDFAPFILDLADGKTPKQMHGKSFASVLDGKQPKSWRKATYYRYWMHRAHHDVPAHFGVRSKRYKLVFFYGSHYDTKIPYYYDQKHLKKGNPSPIGVNTPPAWEFYDLEYDPQEQINRYNDKAYKEIIAELKQEMLEQRKTYGETDKAYPHIQEIIDKHWDS